MLNPKPTTSNPANMIARTLRFIFPTPDFLPDYGLHYYHAGIAATFAVCCDCASPQPHANELGWDARPIARVKVVTHNGPSQCRRRVPGLCRSLAIATR